MCVLKFYEVSNFNKSKQKNFLRTKVNVKVKKQAINNSKSLITAKLLNFLVSFILILLIFSHINPYKTGHTRQGLRCRICKVNAHADCASQLPKCQVKAKLLRRQKSTSEIENRVEQEEESE